MTNDMAEAAYAAIADPTRRRILRILKANGPMASSDVAKEIPELARPGVSRHLRILARAELVRPETQAQKRIYHLRRDGFERLAREWLHFLEDDWRDRIAQLKQKSELSEGKLS